MKIAVLSNVNMDMLIGQLSKGHEVFKTEGYGQWISYALTKNNELLAFNPKVIYVLADGMHLSESVRDCGIYLEKLAENYPLSTIAIGSLDADSPKLECRWDEMREELYKSHSNVIKFDLAELIKDFGREKFYADKMWYMGSIPYSLKAMDALSEKIGKFSERLERTRKKVLVVDLDNTIWGGVVGEDGAEGITLSESNLGAAYRDTQKEIKKIGESGILLAIASKNNEEDVRAAFEKNRFMVLKKEDFTVSKINWELKSQNIRAMAKELNLGLDSFVFLDDNEVERAEVKASIPEISIADFPRDIANLPKAVRSIYEEYFWTARKTKEDESKKEQYRQEAQRAQALESAASIDEYIKSLNIDIQINQVKEAQYQRTVQLLNKTNQFNTNTVRMDQQQFMEYIADEKNKVYVASVSDKYGDSGLVSIVLGRREGEAFTIENFIMSCRVMGRQIENAIIKAVSEKAYRDGAKTIKASFVRSAKNKPVEELWDRLGFEKTEDSTEELKNYTIKAPAAAEAILEAKWV